MPHLYHHFATYDYWDAENSFRHGHAEAVTTAARRIEGETGYMDWRARLLESIQKEIGWPVVNLRVESLSYLGETEEGGGSHD